MLSFRTGGMIFLQGVSQPKDDSALSTITWDIIPICACISQIHTNWFPWVEGDFES